jgi:hypothetical protein
MPVSIIIQDINVIFALQLDVIYSRVLALFITIPLFRFNCRGSYRKYITQDIL